ncbi:MAG: 23S rRNA (adenine(2030)-N(6))-methyltransferase RlmJ [Hyphomonadaceae bacterium]|nr:23S rRNA (adenine(2030)-N(6))-methyltransferase RlmJ [Hyphomonadaceae bacterium]
MNYRHAFHAGNFADVVKHVALALCLDRLNAKEAPYRYIDTHAGVGRYDLTSDEALRSPEWRDGVARVWEAERSAPNAVRAALAPWLNIIRGMNSGGLRDYPGSPLLAAELMRQQDALRLCELHPESAAALRLAMGRDKRVKIEERDGYEALPAYLPPPERRGLVLIDPPFEEGTSVRKLDFEWMAGAALKAVKRWPGGTYIFWRPIKDIEAVEAFDGELVSLLIEQGGIAPEKLLVADLWVREIGQGPLSGAGVVIVNPPFGVADHLRAALPWLSNLMDQTPDEQESTGAGWRLETPAPAEPS